MKKELVGYFTFYNKNGLHYKVKVMFLSMWKIKIYFFKVFISNNREKRVFWTNQFQDFW
jgi:hypothetical protein